MSKVFQLSKKPWDATQQREGIRGVKLCPAVVVFLKSFSVWAEATFLQLLVMPCGAELVTCGMWTAINQSVSAVRQTGWSDHSSLPLQTQMGAQGPPPRQFS